MSYKWRAAEAELRASLHEERMVLLKGPRQAGKTTLLKHLQRTIGGTYYTLDDSAILEIFEQRPEDLITDQITYIDEIQNSAAAGRILRYLYDHTDGRFVVSGSGAFDKKLGISAYLVGRIKEIPLLPLSFQEMVRWRAPKVYPIYQRYYNSIRRALYNGEAIDSPPRISQLEIIFKEYLRFGGYPKVVLTSQPRKEEILRRIAHQTVEKDIVHFFGLPEKSRIFNFLKELTFFAGKIFEASRASVDYKTAVRYLSILEESFILKSLPAFYRNPLKEIKKAKKLYFYDLGFRRVFTEIDTGHVIENYVFRQLLPEHYWRDKKGNEVDFVLMGKDGPIPIEVKTKGQEKKGFYVFLNTYEPERAFVFHYSWESKIERKGKTTIYHLPLFFL